MFDFQSRSNLGKFSDLCKSAGLKRNPVVESVTPGKNFVTIANAQAQTTIVPASKDLKPGDSTENLYVYRMEDTGQLVLSSKAGRSVDISTFV